MRFIEFKQSSTSPQKYRLELNPQEAEEVKDLLQQIIERLNKNEKK
jgi:hypothetical protein|tara:strand:+ start:888 stop:1025 length:138 start_codon:yes stop_codon:yes gene_type:complete